MSTCDICGRELTEKNQWPAYRNYGEPYCKKCVYEFRKWIPHDRQQQRNLILWLRERYAPSKGQGPVKEKHDNNRNGEATDK